MSRPLWKAERCLERLSKGAIAALTILAVMIATTMGCRELKQLDPPSSPSGGAVLTQLDAGIIFGDEPSYLCFSIDRFGLRSAAQIRDVVSSCECVRPSIVEYRNAASERASAIRFDFLSEDGVADTSVSSLAVNISLALTSGETRQFTLQFLHTPTRLLERQ